LSHGLADLIASVATSATAASLFLDALRRLKRFRNVTKIEGLVANQLRKSSQELMRVFGEQDCLKQIYEKADRIAEALVKEMGKAELRAPLELAQVLHNVISEEGVVAPAEVVQELSRLFFNDLAAILASGGWLVRHEAQMRLRVTRDPGEIREIRLSVSAIPTKPKKHSVDKIPGSYARRIFVGGPYDDLPTLREIARYVKREGFVPMIAYDFEIPRENDTPLLDIHDMDILLLHSCRAAIFELSLAAGQYNEVEWSIRQFRKKTLGLCKGREKDQLPKDLMSTMVLDLFTQSNQPLRSYSRYSELRHKVADFLRALS